MTIICYRDSVMASDSLASQGDLRAAAARKIFKLPGGELLGSSGSVTEIDAFRRWCAAGRVGGECPLLEEGFGALLVETDGTVKCYDRAGRSGQIDAPFHVMGSGREVAFGAMAFGASAIEAAEIAAQYVEGCGGPIQIERLGVDA